MTLSKYIAAAMDLAKYRTLSDGSFHGRIPGFRGVWSNEATVESCRRVLQEVLEEWIVLKVAEHDPLPRIRGKSLHVPVSSHA